MNLFSELRSRHGQQAVKHVSDLENLEKKIARHRNHLTFTQRCKDKGVTPTSLKLRCPINTNKARNIIDKAQKELRRERIRVVSNRVSDLNKLHEKSRKNLLETLNNERDVDVQCHVEKHLETKRNSEHEKSKERQIKKLNLLETRQNEKEKVKIGKDVLDLSGTQLKRWVVNTTERELTRPQNTLLAKGLNYAVSVDKIPHEEFIIASEKACWKLPQKDAQNLRAEVAGVLSRRKFRNATSVRKKEKPSRS